MTGWQRQTSIVLVLLLASCIRLSPNPPASHTVTITEYPPLDWSVNMQHLRDSGCEGQLPASCSDLIALGCDEVQGPGFYLGGLQPLYPIMECIHANGAPPDPDFFRQPDGLDTRYRTFVIYQEGTYRYLIQKSAFRALFAPVESPEEALSFAMALTGLKARFNLNPDADVEYLVDAIAETHVEEVPEGYLVYLFDHAHQMGCAIHPFYAVQVLVTPEGQAREVKREEIYRTEVCFDFEALTLVED
ncbi:MAG: hypothetical protein JW892_07970 [Anaerolineae bacterium]|nr:hypothetical protein [Anaerolineae bacterium]